MCNDAAAILTTRWIILTVCMLCCATSLAEPTKDQIIDSWKLLEEQEESEQKAYTVEFKLALEIVADKGEFKIINRSRKYYVKIKKGYKFLKSVDDADPTPVIYARSPRYSFTATGRRSQNNPEEWALARYHDNPDDPKVKAEELSFPAYGSFPVWRPLSTMSTSTYAAEWYGNTNFKFRPQSKTKTELSSYDYSHPDKAGTITIDTSRENAIVLSEGKLSPPGKSTFLFQDKFTRTFASDQPPANRLPQCQEITYVYRHLKDNRELTNARLIFRDYSYDDIPDDIFYLSHYGLPEPPGKDPPPRKTPRYVWFIVAAGAFAVIAVMFRWLTRRTQAVQPA